MLCRHEAAACWNAVFVHRQLKSEMFVQPLAEAAWVMQLVMQLSGVGIDDDCWA